MKYLGIDWGMRRIGFAVSEGTLATPFKSLTVSGLNDAIEKVRKVVETEGVDVIVLGQPEGEMGKKVEEVTKKLQQAGFNVVLADETLSTQQAKNYMIEMGFSKKDRGEDNAVASAIILQQFLDEQT